ncbi:MAG TPA: alpha/beta hydrolase [Polyangiaceae bacterium]|jgi:pimeloyl-ACP methyl ester carboxylesterase|nr:alpha/beta hydrolase [Polyangiaceae bacterium]
MFECVEFPSEGATLRGRLYLPAAARGRSPVVVMAHGLSATITEMSADRYAEVFQDAGLAVLLFDHRNFGMSDGEPRQQINKWTQARGYRDALNFLATRSEIDPARMALWGDSMSAAEVIVVGAIDPRVKAIVAQVPACGDSPPPVDPDGLLFAEIREKFQSGDVSGTPENTFGPLPVVSCDQTGTPSILKALSAYRWFIEHGCRFGSLWHNFATLVSPATPNAVLCAAHLEAPLMVVYSPEDEMGGCSPAMTRLAFEAARGPKQLLEVAGGHFGLLYWPSPLFELASRAQRTFLTSHLR